MAVPVVETQGLGKRYGSLTALKELTLTIEEGSIYGFIGPNGAGKTTTLKILATLLLPSRGTAKICGVDLREGPAKIRPLVGYMPDFFGVYDDMKVWEYMDFFGAAFKLPREKRLASMEGLLALVNLEDKRNDYVESLSRGMKQRLCLARALIHDPALLILDEPASGLDPRARVEMRELLKELKQMGKTIIVSSHILPELSELCTHIGIIERGTLLVSDEVNRIIEGIQEKKVIKVRVLGGHEERFWSALQSFGRAGEVSEVTAADGLGHGAFSVELTGGDEATASFLAYLIEASVKVVSYAEEPTDLEDIFFKVTKGAVQ